MALPDDIVKMGLKEEEIMMMLFKEDLRGLQGDAFDGSEEETKIFRGTFCNNGVDSLSDPDSAPGTSKVGRAVQCRIVESFGHGYLSSYSIRCILPGSRQVSQDKSDKPLPPNIITSETEPDAVNQTSQLGSMPQDNRPTLPVLTAFPSCQMEPEKVSETNQREVVNEGSTVPVSISSPISQIELANTIQTKQTELVSQHEKGVPSPEIKSNAIIQTEERFVDPHDQSTVPLPCTPSPPCMELTTVNQTDQSDIASQGRSGIVPVPISTTPPSSQIGQRGEPSSSLCSDTLDVSKIENPSLKCLCTHLRAHANRLLADYGYKLEVRTRKVDPERFKYVYLYRLPDGGVSHLPKTWLSLGKLLESSPTGSDLEKTHLLGRQWVDADEFASDLKSTLTYIEKMLRDQYCVLTLSDQWFLLDPFMAVVYIDQKLGALKKGVPLKVVQSATKLLDGTEMMGLKRNDGTNTITYSRRRCIKSLLPHLALETELEKKIIGADMCMEEGPIVPNGAKITVPDIKDIKNPVTIGEKVKVPSAKELHNSHFTNGEEVQSVNILQVSSIRTGEGAPCTKDFHASRVKVGEEVPITTGDEMQVATGLHSSGVTTGEEPLHAADINATTVTVEEELLVNPIRTGDEVPFSISHVAGYDNIPTGATFTINRVSQSTVPQQPALILYPPDVAFPFDIINRHCQRSTEIDLPIYQGSLFQGIFSFDANSRFQIQESPITGAVYQGLESISKRKHKTTSSTKENKPRKRPKKNEDKGLLDEKYRTHNRKRQGRKRVCRFHDHDLLMSAIITKKFLNYRKYPIKAPKQKPIRSKHSDQIVQLGQTYSDNKKRFTQGARTVLRLLINAGMVSVNSKIQYRNSKGMALKEGKLTKHGILCHCCDESFTISGFLAHVGCKTGNPAWNLFLGYGKPYVLCLFKAWSVEYKGRRAGMEVRDGDIERNNDMCGLCGDGGELVCCDNCASSFHESCMPYQQIPEDCWHCPRCRCGACEEMIVESLEISSSTSYLQCSQCERRFHEKCMKSMDANSSESAVESWFCGNQCQQVYMYLRSQVGLANYFEDGYYFSILRCDHGQTKILNLEKLVQLAENNMKLALALRITEECFFPILDLRTGVDLIPLVLYNWRVNILSLDYTGFYTVVLEKDERIISVASIRLHGAMVAEMPLVATCIENRRQGMCRRLVSAIEEMLKSLKVPTLLVCAIPSLVDTWTSSFGFVSIEDGDKEILSKIKLINMPGTYLLKKDLTTISVGPKETEGDDGRRTSGENEFNGAGEGEENFPLDTNASFFEFSE